MRFSLSWLLVSVAIISVSVSAFVNPSDLSLRLMRLVVLVLLIVSATAFAHCSNYIRAYSLGFLVASVPYVFMTEFLSSHRLATQTLFEMADRYWHLSKERTTPAGETVRLYDNGTAQIRLPGKRSQTKTWGQIRAMGYMRYAYRSDQLPSAKAFIAIGHLIFAIVLGAGNGVLACYLARKCSGR